MKNPYTILIGSTFAAQLFLFAISPIITRIYTPEDVGAFGIVLAIGAFLATLSTGRLELALPTVKNRIASIQVSILAFTSIICFTILVCVVLSSIYFSNALDDKTWSALPLFSIPAICFSLGFYNFLNSLLVRKKSFSNLAKAKLYQSFLTGISQLILPFFLNGSLALILGQFFGYFFGGIVSFKNFYKELLAFFLSSRLNMKETFVIYRKFLFILAPAAIFNQMTQHLPVLAIGYIFGLYSAGLYLFVFKICNVPLALLGQSISQIYSSDIRSFLYSPGENISRRYFQLLLKLSVSGFILILFFVVLLFYGGTIFFGNNWQNMGTVAILLSPMFFADFVSTPISTTLAFLDKHKQQLKWDFFRFFSVFSLFLFVVIFEVSHGRALFGLSIVWCFNAIIHVCLSYKACLIHSRSSNILPNSK